MAARTRPPSAQGTDHSLAPLVDLAQAGDEVAFRLLYERFAPRLYRYVYFRLGSPEVAQEAVQEIFLAVWRSLPGFEARHEAGFVAWLFRIAHNVTMDFLRRGRGIQAVPLDEAGEGSVEFEGSTVTQRLIVQLLGTLTDLQREVIVLRFLAGMTLAEVARSLGKDEGAIEQLQLRGIRRLRRELSRA